MVAPTRPAAQAGRRRWGRVGPRASACGQHRRQPHACLNTSRHLRPAPPCSRQVVLPQCFRPGDIVCAAVISLGDARSYYLSTAQNELGVVYARSIAGGLAPVCMGKVGLGVWWVVCLAC